MAAKRPSFQFYSADWLKDPAVRSVSLSARGLWIDMLCLMDQSSRRGYLQHATGKPVTAEQLARMTGCSTDDASRLLQELTDSGVCRSTDHGVIYSKRMVEDEKTRQFFQEAGKKGGNPALTGRRLNGQSTPALNPRSQPPPKPSSSSTLSTSWSDVLTDLTLEELNNPSGLRARYGRCVSAGLIQQAEATERQFFAFSCRARRKHKKNPCGLFRYLVQEWKIGDLVDEDDDEASKMLKSLQRSA